MRLIDADDFIEQAYPLTGVPLERIKNAPTIDPVKAAGGCYCRECRWYDAGKNDSESWSDCTIRYGKHFNVSPMDFCSYGQRKESAHE
jgi:hypothetical protein